jgi:hypothetical protein
MKPCFLLATAGAVLLLSGAWQSIPERTATEVADYLTKETGISVFVHSRVAKEKVVVSLAEKATKENLAGFVQRLAKALPSGAGYARLHLPPPPQGKTWKADDVIAYARAQAVLYGTVGSIEDGTIEILSQKIPEGQAKGVISSLNLRPVYIVTPGRGTFTGTWNTTFGEMRLQQNGRSVKGTYSTGDGHIDGLLDRDVLVFRWYEANGSRSGPGTFKLSQDGDSFAGTWSYDYENDLPGQWVGTRLSYR